MPQAVNQRCEPPASDQKRILVGRIGAAYGVKGELRLTSFTQDPKAIADYGPLQDARGARLKIIALRPLKDNLVIARFAGVTTRGDAEALRNTDLYLAREALPAAAEDEFYHADLIGLAALNARGESLGHVAQVLNFGGGDILEIAPAGGGEAFLLPFTKDAVPVVDLTAGTITVVPPAEIDAEPSCASGASPEPAPPPAQTSPAPH